MRGWSSGRRLKELGLGQQVVLPSDRNYPVVLHGEQTPSSVARILGIDETAVTDADLVTAVANAKANQAYDTLIREALNEGAERYGEDRAQVAVREALKAIPQPSAQQPAGRSLPRIAGETLLLGGSGALLGAYLAPQPEAEVILMPE